MGTKHQDAMKSTVLVQTTQDTRADQPTIGHRQRLRARFLSGEDHALTEDGLIELLLTFAIPQKDVRPLAVALLERFGSLQAVLDASPEALRQIPGIGDATIALLKLVGHLAKRNGATPRTPRVTASDQPQPSLFTTEETRSHEPKASPLTANPPKVIQRSRTGLFGKGLMKDSLALLPEISEAESIEEVRTFLRGALHFNSAKTRQRYAAYIAHRLFPEGVVDKALRLFAKRHPGTQALRDVCFYRFMEAEPLIGQFVRETILLALGRGLLPRSKVRQFLEERFPAAKPKTIQSTASAIIEVLTAVGLARLEKAKLTFQLREVCIESFAFILHSEFPEPGMYDVGKIEASSVFEILLWRPDKLVPALYELRNRGWISKVSEIDQIRQFTTRYNLNGLVQTIVGQGGVP